MGVGLFGLALGAEAPAVLGAGKSLLTSVPSWAWRTLGFIQMTQASSENDPNLVFGALASVTPLGPASPRAAPVRAVSTADLNTSIQLAAKLDLPTAPYTVASTPGGSLAFTDKIGEITINPAVANHHPDFLKYILRHEAGHRMLSPTAGPMWLREARGTLSQAGFERFQFVHFAEELFAETYATRSVVQGFRYAMEPDIGLSALRVVTGGAVYGGAVGGLSYGSYKFAAPRVFGPMSAGRAR